MKDKTIDSKTFISKILFSMFIIVICLSMMSMSAFAFFSYSISSANNVIASASYSLSIEHKQQGITEDSNGYFVLDNKSNTVEAKYYFKLSKASSASASVGFAKVLLNDGVNESAYFTSPIGKYGVDGNNVEANTRYFTVTVPANSEYLVKFIAEWGSSSSQEIISDTGIIVEVNEDAYLNAPDMIEVILEEETEELETVEELEESQEVQEEEIQIELDEEIIDDGLDVDNDQSQENGNQGDNSESESDEEDDTLGDDNQQETSNNQEDQGVSNEQESIIDDVNGNDEKPSDEGDDVDQPSDTSENTQEIQDTLE